MDKNTLEKLKADLIRHEGLVNSLYLDHLGFKTGGVGHLITQDDKDYINQPVGSPVDKKTINKWLSNDIKKAVVDCKTLFNDFEKLPNECQCLLANMAFNLGRTRLGKFKKLIAAIADNDYKEASIQMKDSRWFKQVKGRAVEMCERMSEVEL